MPRFAIYSGETGEIIRVVSCHPLNAAAQASDPDDVLFPQPVGRDVTRQTHRVVRGKLVTIPDTENQRGRN